MVATAAMIAEISEYQVDDEGDLTKATFARLSAVAQARLDQEDPGLASALYDHAHALLILHLFESGKMNKGAMTSERLGDYSYGKEAGATSFLIEYRAILASGAQASMGALEGQERSDAAMEEMHLDQADVPAYPPDDELEDGA